MDFENIIPLEAGLEVSIGVNKGYCPKCKKFLTEVKGNFVSGRQRYIKYVCENCDIIYKKFVESYGDEDDLI